MGAILPAAKAWPTCTGCSEVCQAGQRTLPWKTLASSEE